MCRQLMDGPISFDTGRVQFFPPKAAGVVLDTSALSSMETSVFPLDADGFFPHATRDQIA